MDDTYYDESLVGPLPDCSRCGDAGCDRCMPPEEPPPDWWLEQEYELRTDLGDQDIDW